MAKKKRAGQNQSTIQPIEGFLYFKYNQDNAWLDVRYDEAAKRVVIRGGPDALAHLAELLFIWAQEPSVSYEDEHWELLRSDDFALNVYMVDKPVEAFS